MDDGPRALAKKERASDGSGWVRWFPMALETWPATRSPDREWPPLGLPIPQPRAKHGKNEVAGGGKKEQTSVSSRWFEMASDSRGGSGMEIDPPPLKLCGGGGVPPMVTKLVDSGRVDDDGLD